MTTSQKSMDESFLMTNISPQVGAGFNRAYWSRFEGFVRHIANLYNGAFVVTGPLYLPKVWILALHRGGLHNWDQHFSEKT